MLLVFRWRASASPEDRESCAYSFPLAPAPWLGTRKRREPRGLGFESMGVSSGGGFFFFPLGSSNKSKLDYASPFGKEDK